MRKKIKEEENRLSRVQNIKKFQIKQKEDRKFLRPRQQMPATEIHCRQHLYTTVASWTWRSMSHHHCSDAADCLILFHCHLDHILYHILTTTDSYRYRFLWHRTWIYFTSDGGLFDATHLGNWELFFCFNSSHLEMNIYYFFHARTVLWHCYTRSGKRKTSR